MGTYLLVLGILAGRPGMGLGLPTPKTSLLNFYPLHVGVGATPSMSPPLVSVWMDVVSLILSLSDFYST